MTEFFKFPHTPHLVWLGATPPRDDKVLTAGAVEAFLENPLVVEEKLDGANVGFSFTSDGKLLIQNRGQYLNSDVHGQFKGIWKWARHHEDALLDVLTDKLILFGEWCYARHTIRYDSLPDWFVGFDVYDRTCGKFWSTQRRNRLLEAIGALPVTELAIGKFDQAYLLDFLRATARYGAMRIEGLYLRHENAEFLLDRAKIVNADFVSGIKSHWSRAPLIVNGCLTANG